MLKAVLVASVLCPVAGAPVDKAGRALVAEDDEQVRKTQDASSSIFPTSASDAVYIRTLHDGKVWDDGRGRVYMHDAHGGDNQKFYAEMLTVTDFRLRNKGDPNKCLDLHPSNNYIYMGNCHEGSNQKFYFEGDQAGLGRTRPNAAALKSRHADYSSRCLDYHTGDNSLYFGNCHNNGNQDFYFDMPFPPPSPPPPPPPWWTVTSGSAYCHLSNSGTCVTDGIGDYGNNERCTVRANQALVASTTQYQVERHSTRYNADYLTIGGISYKSGTGPSNVSMSAGQTLTWRTSGSDTWTIDGGRDGGYSGYSGRDGDGGFTLCATAEPLAPHPSPPPTQNVADVEGNLRLVDGTSANRGRLEVYHSSQWGTVCDDRFDRNDAIVACRQLGLDAPPTTYQYDAGDVHRRGQIWMDELECTGSESSLSSCTFGEGRESWAENCGHYEDVGLICGGTDVYLSPPPSPSHVAVAPPLHVVHHVHVRDTEQHQRLVLQQAARARRARQGRLHGLPAGGVGASQPSGNAAIRGGADCHVARQPAAASVDDRRPPGGGRFQLHRRHA